MTTEYERLERLKVEAERWIAGVAGDGSMAGAAARGLREIIDKAAQAPRPEGRRKNLDDGSRLEWLCERLVEHSLYINRYQKAHELPHGGFAVYTNSTLLGYGETISDAIDHAMKAEALRSPLVAKDTK